MLRAMLVLIAAFGCFGLVTLAQPGDKKGDAVKGKEDKAKAKDPGKSKTPEKTLETPKDPPKAKTPLDRLKLNKDAIVIILDDPLEALSLFGKLAVMEFDKYVEREERIKALERQLKPVRKIPAYCDLTGEIVGDFIEFDAEFRFSTEAPNTSIVLGLQGAYLLKPGDLDGQMPIYDHNKDDGFVVKAAKEDKHRLTCSFRVPIQVKKSSGGAIERGIEFGLPGAIVTTLKVRLPDNVKEMRCNDTLEKIKKEGRWQPALAERTKSVTLTWKEPTAASSNAPLRKAEAQIKVDIDATHVNLSAELSFEDSRPQSNEWHLLLPKQAKIVEIKAPGGTTPDWKKPTDAIPYHILSIPDQTSERWQVSISMRVPRPNPGARLAIGPFHVLGAFEQKGTISVKMPSDASIGQRLSFVRGDGVYEILQIKNTETEAAFTYLAPPNGDKNVKAPAAQKAPLELEWRLEKNQLETQVTHELRLQTSAPGWEIDAVSFIKVKALFAGINAVDLKLPTPRPRGLGLIGTAAPGLVFPGALPWPGMLDNPWDYADPDDLAVQDELGTSLKLAPLDAAGKTRVFLERTPAPREITLKLRSKIRVAAESRRIRLELPRPLGTQDRAAKITIQSDERVELLHGPAGAEEPLPNPHRLVLTPDSAPTHVDLAWKPYRREIVAQSTIDITLHENTAQIKQVLLFPRDLPALGDAKGSLIKLKAPPEVDTVTQFIGRETFVRTPVQQTLWLPATENGDKVELVLLYDLVLPQGRVFQVTPILPAHVSQQDVKVRVWTGSGVKARLTEELAKRGVWKERSIEIVPGKEQFPVLVLHGYGSNLPLALKVEDAATSTLAAFLADRALIQVRMLADGSQHCKARYLIRKIHAPYVDLELPLPLARFHERPRFALGAHLLQAETLDPSGKLVRIKLHPDQVSLPAILEIDCTIPVDAVERTSFWRTTLHAPIFQSEVVIGQMRWQLTTTTPVIAASLSPGAAAETQWSLQGWLPTPESSVTSADWDRWLTDKESVQEDMAVTCSFTHLSMTPETVYHLHRRWWLLGCSGLLLIVALGSYFSRLPRPAFWLLLLGLALAVSSLGIFAPALLPAVLFGLQPGAVLLLLFVSAHWLLLDRHRHPLASGHGFSRAKPSSTMVRTTAPKRAREASTVDAPGPALTTEMPEEPASEPSSS